MTQLDTRAYRVLWNFCLLTTLFFSFLAQADDEYLFQWLDPDKKVYVLQNRKYVKAQRVQLTLMTGVAINETYRNTIDVDFRGSYFFTENYGIEFFYQGMKARENNPYVALKNSTSTGIPVIREPRSNFGALFLWAPWYAKINVFNSIIYFDWYFTGGLGRYMTALDTNTLISGSSNFVNQDFTALYIGTGHQFYFHQNWFVRWDYMGTFYSAPIYGNAGSDKWFSLYGFHLGVGYRF